MLGETPFSFDFHVGDEGTLAPSALFYPDLLMHAGAKNSVKTTRTMGKDRGGDPEDPHDHVYLAETSRKYTKVSP